MLFRSSPGLWAVLDALATYRLTRLVTSDRITEGARRRAGGWDPAIATMTRPGLFDFLTCPWCVGIWVAAAVVGLTAGAPSVWRYPAAGLAFAAVAGWLAEHA